MTFLIKFLDNMVSFQDHYVHTNHCNPTLIVSFLDEISRTLCGSDESSVDTFSNTAKLKFKSLSSSRGSNLGFLASINASVEACGGTLEGSTGTIQTPGMY